MRLHQNPVLRFVLTVLAVFASGVGGVAYANHFSDVPGTHFFHPEVAAIAGAGCATGFNDGTFRPGDNTTRGQFAFWFNNCAPRVGDATMETPTDVPDSVPADGFRGADVSLLTQGFEIGGTNGVQQVMLVVSGRFTNYTAHNTSCALPACSVFLDVYIDGDLVADGEATVAGDYGGATVAANGVWYAQSGAHTIEVKASSIGSQPASPIEVDEVDLSFITGPFKHNGVADF